MTRTPTPVVVGVIDDGIAFAHERFRLWSTTPAPHWETRVEFWWLQDGPFLNGPNNLGWGRELGKSDIQTLLDSCTRAGVVDEDQVYRRARLIDFHRHGHNAAAWRAAHGTHVMDLACGYDSQDGRDDRPIVCVQLPARVTADTSGSQLFPHAAMAIFYILVCAKQIAQSRGTGLLPVVINLSYGTIGGPHDGTGHLESIIDNLIAPLSSIFCKSLDIVLPAGNSHLSRCHAQVSFESTDPVELHWRIQPDDWTPSELEIWLPFRSGGGPSRLELTVTPPGGLMSNTVDENSTSPLELKDAGGQIYCQVLHADFSGRSLFLVKMQPTYDPNPAAPRAPAGVWTITLTNTNLTASEIVHAWIRRDESLYGHPRRGRQSYFEDPLYERYDHAGREVEDDNSTSRVRRAGLLNAIATGRVPIVIGGLVRNTRVPAKYSAAGPITPQQGASIAHRDGPDALVASEDSLVHGGVLAAGSRSGSVVAMGGTSVAAPQLARWIADERAQSEPGGRGAVKTRALADDPNPPKPEPTRRGGGRIRLNPINPLQRCRG